MAVKYPVFEPRPDTLDPADKQHIRLSVVIHYYFDQSSPQTLIDLLRRYESFAPDLLDVIQFVVVDDGSPLVFEIPEFDLNLHWLRITENIRWNQGGARNLAVVHAKSDKIVMSDLDHEFSEATLRALVKRGNPGRTIYKFRRFNPMKNINRGPHPNIFFLSRARFLRLYGYDEEFGGEYGYEDLRFCKWHKYHGTWFRTLPKSILCIMRKDVDLEKSYHSLTRDLTRNHELDVRKHNEVLHWGEEAGHSRMFLQFPFETVRVRHRSNRGVPRPRRRWFKHFWWLRTVLGTHT